MDMKEKLEVIAHLGDHITYKEDIGICYDSALAKVIEDAYMELKNGVTVQEWISVKDRLPEKDVKVLAFGVYGFSVNYRDRFSGKWRGVNGRSQWITHWMPLHEPPAELKKIKCHNCNGTDEPELYQDKKYCPNCGARVDA